MKVHNIVIVITVLALFLAGSVSSNVKITQNGVFGLNTLAIGTENPQADFHVAGDLFFDSLESGNLADFKTYNSGGDPLLEIEKGYRSYNGLKITIPQKTISGNMSSSQWHDSSEATEPSEQSFRYFYALAGDTSKIAVSDNPPKTDNKETISGEEYIYIGSALYYNNQYVPAQSSGRKVSFTGSVSKLFGAGSDGRGKKVYRQGGTCSVDRTENLSEDVPPTATELAGKFITYAKVRCDSGCFSEVNSEMRVDGDYLQRDRASYYIDTPIDGSYYPVPHLETMPFEINTDLTDIGSIRFTYSASNCYTDNWSGSSVAVQGYTDSMIY